MGKNEKRSLRIMVVDDHSDTLDSTALLLRMWGHDVIEAHEGKEALSKAESEQPDMILMDLGMPGMTGLDVARELRQRVANKRPVLIAHTGHGRPLHQHLSQDAGFDFMLVKPVSPEDLKDVVDRCCTSA